MGNSMKDRPGPSAKDRWKFLQRVMRGGRRNGGLRDSRAVQESIDQNYRAAVDSGAGGDLTRQAHNTGFLGSDSQWEGVERAVQNTTPVSTNRPKVDRFSPENIRILTDAGMKPAEIIEKLSGIPDEVFLKAGDDTSKIMDALIQGAGGRNNLNQDLQGR